MVVTRTQSGSVEYQTYDLKPLKIRGRLDTPSRPPKRQKVSTWDKIGTARSDKESSKSEIRTLPIPIPQTLDQDEGFDDPPPICFGEAETEGLSAIQRADKRIAQWKAVKSHYRTRRRRVVPMINLRLKEANEKRAALKDTKENHQVINLEARKEMIQNRVECLERGLETSQFEAERENIRCAIAGYQNGDIQYSDRYTLIWAGKIVDTAKDYSEFVLDRVDRLDRYAKEYGPHWLWFERGLKCHPDGAIRLSRCCTLSREVLGHGLGQYFIQQSYQKRAGWVMRMPETDPELFGQSQIPEHLNQDFLKSPDGRIYCQQEGPCLAFRSLLDSGATLPSLYSADFLDLGIDPQLYSAQTIEILGTANGTVESRSYELHVFVLDENLGSLVDPANAVWPLHGKYIGGLMPVVSCTESGETNPDGMVYNMRLSGMLPFLGCYVSSTPTRNKIFFGEDRNDVLGAHRMPGQRRWDISMPSTEPVSAPNWERWQNPKIRFTHRAGQVVDQDVEDRTGASTLTINGGTPLEMTVVSDPATQCEAARWGAIGAGAAEGEA